MKQKSVKCIVGEKEPNRVKNNRENQALKNLSSCKFCQLLAVTGRSLSLVSTFNICLYNIFVYFLYIWIDRD